jgi:hypothetical protein
MIPIPAGERRYDRTSLASGREVSVSTPAADSSKARPGWLTFAAVVMFAVGVMQFIASIYYFEHSSRINDLTGGAFGQHTWIWGVWSLVLAALGITGGYSLLGGYSYGRFIAYFWAGFAIVENLLIVREAPWSGFLGIGLAVLVIYALNDTSGWTEKSY